MSEKKAQVSIELMVVVGFILIFFIPLLVVSYFKSVELNEELSVIQAEVAVSRIANTIDSVGRMGEGSSLVIDVYLPLNSYLEFRSYDPGSEIVLSVQRNSGISESTAVSWYALEIPPNLQGEIPGGGSYRINATAVEEAVSINIQGIGTI